ncbi:cell wall 1,3-beta-glucanosyltransferase Gas2 [Schizosaccharomyces pombe]|uniref:1,3-beta-glucanosyltransferase gas2 n=1 Tax=Schizosaccharomyces pombe (strain 972 / ATCC 24843) TaxID=284812 RepID=GAS2_SCHPO|nr:putative 1,3-beta-glucanosyltransferase Gas2 [Schizosaccharomyces pombe]Q9USU5.1 RecName: Full=1,3-beta-glucanosyltransferase gas2; Flags: Precursor [Schizosaccharomyces pombe 972h-]CAA22436.1 1,3-beta-glucanosyltransferase Gas2 (predicted) [Schizosaccharomyces pombe]|eukprot:NP_596053.1 putative 1,3-beta-glucanosyltransferase Gas2 [Schizosaccharomyces pombe]
MVSFTKFTLQLLSASAAFAYFEPLTIKGRKFFKNDTQFYIKGVAYQPAVDAEETSTIVDPLAEVNYKNCTEDAKIISNLGANVIRVYAVNASLNHDKCMEAFRNESIYVFLDLANPKTGIDRDTPTWNTDQFSSYQSVIDTFQKYNNTGAFFAGNEVVNNASNAPAVAYVRAAVRDSKNYIKSKKYRTIPVGYAGADIPVVRTELAAYLSCNATKLNNDTNSETDFLGYNMYEWCGHSDFYTSGYAARTQELENFTIPIFLSEFGCNKVTPRVFTEVQAIYSDNMTNVWSGGIVYEYSQEVNDYGLVNVSSTGERVLTTDYNNLKKQWASISPNITYKHSYNPNGTIPECPSRNKTSWAVSANAFPVTPNTTICSNAVKNLKCSANGTPSGSKISQVLSELCYYDNKACSSISSDPYEGTYGNYTGCTGVQQLSIALNAYTQDHGADSCSWGGVGELKA